MLKKIIIILSILFILGVCTIIYLRQTEVKNPLFIEHEQHQKDKKNLSDTKKMELCIIKNLNIKENDEFKDKLSKITEFNCDDWDLRTLPYIDKMTNLKKLTLNYNKISDFSILIKLKELEYLDLSVNDITNIDTIKELKKLKYLDLSENYIKKIDSFKNNQTISFLALYNNQITNLDILKTMKYYKQFNQDLLIQFQLERR